MQESHVVFFVFPLWLLTSQFQLLDAHHSRLPNFLPDKCKLPPKQGECKAALPGVYYDTKTGDCQFFTHGFCQGNENKYESPLDCIRECERFDIPPPKCKLPAVQGNGKLILKRYYYDFNDKICKILVYYGTGGNANNFESNEVCFEHCAQFEQRPAYCELPKEKGTCKGTKTRYYFNSKSRKCEEFQYGGCRGNGNNFHTLIDCVRNCESYS